MKTLFLLCFTMSLWGQNAALVIQLKHIKVGYGLQLANAFGNGKVNVQTRPDSPGLVLSGPPELLAVIESAIRKADVPLTPAPNVELTFYILAGGEGANGGPLPEDLSGVAKQVKGLLGMAGLKMVESIQIRTRAGSGGEASGVMGKSVGNPSYYQLRFGEVLVEGEPGARFLRLGHLKFGGKIAIGQNYVETGFNTDVDLRDGQKIVIGKSSLDTSGTPFFIVVTGKVVE
ncbi:MAG: hypothetical protein ACK6DY_10445 [Acidobacteriota bacterium]|jgi:hypothetical protein